LLGAGIGAYRRWFRQETYENTPRWFVTSLLLTGLVIGVATLFFSRPDSDDVAYMANARLETKDLNGYFSVLEFRLAGLSENPEELYRAFPYEAFVAAASNRVGIEPLQSYHNLAMIFLCMWWVIVYGLFFRALRLSHRDTLIALTLTILFLVIDSHLHRSHGNFSFMRLWQGKVIMIAILLPQILMSSLRFLQNPTRLDWIRLCAAVVIATEFSRSAIFLTPLLLVACVVAARWSGMARWRTGFTLLLAGWLPAAFGAWIVLTAILPSLLADSAAEPNRNSAENIPPMEAEWRALLREVRQEAREQQVNIVQSTQNFSPNWYNNLYDAGIGSNVILIRNFVLILLPFFLIRKPEGKFITLYNLTLIVLVATPLTGPVIINLIGNTGYWRVLYLLSLPLCFALLVGLVQWPFSSRQGLFRWAVAAISILICVAGFQKTILSNANNVRPKAPWELRLAAQDLVIAQETESILSGAFLVAVQPLSHTLSLTVRENMSALAYDNLTGASTSWNFVDNLLQCRPDPRLTPEMIDYALDEFGATHIFMRNCGTVDDTDTILHAYLPGWQRASQYGNYWLLQPR
jgi:hypothetical protein